MYYFIINPKSQSGRGEKIWLEIKRKVELKKIDYKYFVTEKKGDAQKFAKEISSDLTEKVIIVVLGGDGTLNEVINGLKNINLITLGIIPTGSGNDFVRSYGKIKDLNSHVEKILNPKDIVKYNIGYVENEYGCRNFIVSSGFGFDATITNEVNNAKSKIVYKNTALGKLIYAFSALKVMASFKPLELKITEGSGERIFKSCYFCVIMNTAYEGKAVMLCPQAKGYDDFLDLCIFNTKSKTVVIYLILKAFFGRHENSNRVYISKGRKYKVECLSSTHCHVDGEQLGRSTWAEYGLRNEKINIIVK
ncbi:diacylglycerol/lipid kinase family protein [Anaerosphaera multitolerans]|uniref:Diacylglycerol kinase family lipid kinase n=1 Tax=Anaerosphaera multitolerans TaxID=2487351 RepID=A0A437S5N2_9FIRM|nr:diacylglycerol kinase family protein [Anaerosphaera multitolerans]RVU54216.1 diacylglycerol kinase family lipid kinase [Anaerosphaera multitolerans]